MFRATLSLRHSGLDPESSHRFVQERQLRFETEGATGSPVSGHGITHRGEDGFENEEGEYGTQTAQHSAPEKAHICLFIEQIHANEEPKTGQPYRDLL